MKVLDLSQEKRPTIRIILPRKKRAFLSRKLKLDVFTPTKSTREAFTFLGESLIKISKNEATDEDLDTLYDVTARILSRNKQNIDFTQADLESRFDTANIIAILKTYADFLSETIKSKN